MQQETNTGNAAATLIERAKPYVANWTLQKTFRLCKHGVLGMGVGFILRFIGGVSSTAPLQTFGEILALLGILGIVLGLVAGIIHSHIAIIRSKDKTERGLAIRVLATSYGIVLGIFGIAAFFGNGPAFLKPIGAVALIVMFLGFIFLAMVIMGIASFGELGEAFNFTPSGSKRLYNDLPTVEEYMAQNPREGHRQIACNRCGSPNIHQFGLTRESDDRRVFKCMTCNTFLYKKDGATY